MNTAKKKRIAAWIAIALAIGILVYWKASSGELATMTEIPVEITETDDVFGTTVTKKEWRPGFRLGLEYAGAAAGPLLCVGVFLLWSARRSEKRGTV